MGPQTGLLMNFGGVEVGINSMCGKLTETTGTLTRKVHCCKVKLEGRNVKMKRGRFASF